MRPILHLNASPSLQIHSDSTMSNCFFLSIFLYNFTYIYFIWTVTYQFFYFIFLRNIWTIQLQKNLKILWFRNGHFHQINTSNNVFSFIVYIDFAPKCDFLLIFSNLKKFWAWNAGDPHFLSFYLEGHITRKFSLKNLKKINGLKIKPPCFVVCGWISLSISLSQSVDAKFGFALNETWIFNSFIFNETNIKALKVFLSIIKSFLLYNNLKQS